MLFVLPKLHACTGGQHHKCISYLAVSQNQDGLSEFCSEDSQVIVCT